MLQRPGPSLAILLGALVACSSAPEVPPGACDDRATNGRETDLDCGGGTCGGCRNGMKCATGADCLDQVCTGGLCVEATCADGVANQPVESDVDCGRGCAACEAGKKCRTSEDCASGICPEIQRICIAGGCSNGHVDGAETDVDCGGTCPTKCAVTRGCKVHADCDTGVCHPTVFQCRVPACGDGVVNNGETDLECGGRSCDACPVGRHCLVDGDCATGFCDGQACSAAKCADGLKNGLEADVDCGGDCPTCPYASRCRSNEDCSSAACIADSCGVASCTDGLRNGDESSVDCGGATCAARCGSGAVCEVGSDCESQYCQVRNCGSVRCNDGVQNGPEGDVDCGGVCSQKCAILQTCRQNVDCASRSCAPTGRCDVASCSNGWLDGFESDTDCGSATVSSCTRCLNGLRCIDNGSCASGYCNELRRCAAAGCTDGVLNLKESGIDCGGACGGCALTISCNRDEDCASLRCAASRCAATGCGNGVRDGFEGGVDCGAACSAKCAAGSTCWGHADCASGFCRTGTCAAPTCQDQYANGTESDVDCGGSCGDCALGKACTLAGDCASGTCQRLTCAAATCTNGVKDAGESDVDCGVDCAPCPDTRRCAGPGDCLSRSCVEARCEPAPLYVDFTFPAHETSLAAAEPIQLGFSRHVDPATIVPCLARRTPAGCNAELVDPEERVVPLRLTTFPTTLPRLRLAFGHRTLNATWNFPAGVSTRHTFRLLAGPNGPRAPSGEPLVADSVTAFVAIGP